MRGDVRSYQAMSEVQGEAGYACEKKKEVCTGVHGVHGGAWGYTGGVRTGPCVGGPWKRVGYDVAQ